MSRKSIEVPGFTHGQQPIPAACRVGNMIMTGGVRGLDPETGQMGETVEDQARLTFMWVERILAAAGASFDDVIKMTFYVQTAEARAAINPEWLKAFPDAASRPARHSQEVLSLPAKAFMQCDCVAVITED